MNRMELARPHPDCKIDHAGQYVRADVGDGSATEVQECYRTLASLALEHKFTRVLLVGIGQDSHSHLTARDVVIAFDVIGVPADSRSPSLRKPTRRSTASSTPSTRQTSVG